MTNATGFKMKKHLNDEMFKVIKIFISRNSSILGHGPKTREKHCENKLNEVRRTDIIFIIRDLLQVQSMIWLSFHCYNSRWRQRLELSSTGCRTSRLFLAPTFTVESWWSLTRTTWRGTGPLRSTRPPLTRASSAGWPQRTPAPIRLALLILSLPVRTSSGSDWMRENSTCSCVSCNQVMSNPDRRPCHNKDFLRYNNIINGAEWHNVPGSKNVCVFQSKSVFF